MWINPGLLQKADALFASGGLAVADAAYAFLCQTLHAGGLLIESSSPKTHNLLRKMCKKTHTEGTRGEYLKKHTFLDEDCCAV